MIPPGAFDLLLPDPAPDADSWRWGTITSTSPLRVRLDGDADALDVDPDVLTIGMLAGERVYCQLHGRRLRAQHRSPAPFAKACASLAAANAWYAACVAQGQDPTVDQVWVWRSDTGTLERNAGSGWVIYSDPISAAGRRTSFGTPQVFRDVANYYYTLAGLSGNIIFDTPIPVNSGTMASVRIQGFNFKVGFGDVDVTVDFYGYAATSTIETTTYRSTGSLPVTVRLGVNASGKVSIILTSTDASALWAYPNLVVTQVIVGFLGPLTSYGVGWASRVVAEASIAATFTGVVTPPGHTATYT